MGKFVIFSLSVSYHDAKNPRAPILCSTRCPTQHCIAWCYELQRVLKSHANCPHLFTKHFFLLALLFRKFLYKFLNKIYRCLWCSSFLLIYTKINEKPKKGTSNWKCVFSLIFLENQCLNCI